MCKWMCGLWILFLLGCGTDSGDGLTEDERRSQEIWSVTTSLSGLWATYTPVPEDFTVFSDSALVQEFLDINGLSPTLTVRDVARPEKGGTRFKSIRINLDTAINPIDTLRIPLSWRGMEVVQFTLLHGEITVIEGLDNLRMTKDLMIAGTRISRVPNEVYQLPLLALALNANEITELPSELIDFADSNRVSLWMGYNKIHELPENLLRKHWRIEVQGNQICNLDAADSAMIFELSKPSSGGYTLPSEYLSEPALVFYPQKCE